MRSTDITVFYSTLRTEAMERILKEQGKSLDSAVEDMLDTLYQQTVPAQERTEIEAKIRQEEAQAAADTEASRRFGVYHIREQGGDSYFYCEVHSDLYLAACECRQYLQDGRPFLLSKQGMREGVALTLPATPAEASEACAWFERLGISQEQVKIVDASSPVQTLNKYIVSHADIHREGDLEKLNTLAERISQMDKRQMDILGGAIDAESISSLDDVLDISAHLDCYVILPNIVTNAELGRFLVDTGYKDFPEETHPYLNYAAIGSEYYCNNGGAFGPGGYVRRKAAPELEVQVQKPMITIHLYSASLAQSKAPLYRLALPALDEELEQAAGELGVDEIAGAAIVKVELGDETLKELIPTECVSVEDANYLAMSIEELRQHEDLYLKYLAVISVVQPETMTDVLHFTVRLDDYELVPEDAYEYGQAVLRRHGATDEVLSRLIGYMNMEGLGRDAMADDGVRKTEFGSIRRCSEPFPDITQEIEFGGM